MIVAFDVGNSEITIGIFDGEELVSHWRLTTAAPRTADELALLIRSIVGPQIASPEGADGSAICSVVPAITPMLAEACEVCFGDKPIMIDARAKLPIKLDVEEPLTVGADRIANTLAASRIHKKDAIVVDLGTATTYDDRILFVDPAGSQGIGDSIGAYSKRLLNIELDRKLRAGVDHDRLVAKAHLTGFGKHRSDGGYHRADG